MCSSLSRKNALSDVTGCQLFCGSNGDPYYTYASTWVSTNNCFCKSAKGVSQTSTGLKSGVSCHGQWNISIMQQPSFASDEIVFQGAARQLSSSEGALPNTTLTDMGWTFSQPTSWSLTWSMENSTSHLKTEIIPYFTTVLMRYGCCRMMPGGKYVWY